MPITSTDKPSEADLMSTDNIILYECYGHGKNLPRLF